MQSIGSDNEDDMRGSRRQEGRHGEEGVGMDMWVGRCVGEGQE